MKEWMWKRVSVRDKTFVSEKVIDNERSGKEILQRKNTSSTEEKERERGREKQREEEKKRKDRDREKEIERDGKK